MPGDPVFFFPFFIGMNSYAKQGFYFIFCIKFCENSLQSHGFHVLAIIDQQQAHGRRIGYIFWEEKINGYFASQMIGKEVGIFNQNTGYNGGLHGSKNKKMWPLPATPRRRAEKQSESECSNPHNDGVQHPVSSIQHLIWPYAGEKINLIKPVALLSRLIAII